MSAGFVISAEMARRRDLGCAAKLVYAYAARYVTTDDRETGKPGGLEVGEVWLRQRKRAGERPGVDAALGLSHGAVERAVKDLIDAGLLVVTRTPTPAERRSGQVTVYRLPEYSPRNGDRAAVDHSPERGEYSPRNGDGTAPETGTYCSEGIGSDESVENTPPTPLAEGGVEPHADEVEVIDVGAGEVVEAAEPVLTVKRGARIDLAPDGFPLARELRALWAAAVEAAGLTVPAGPDTGDKRARGELARRLAEDGYTPEQLRTAVAHWRGSLYLAGLHDGQIRGLDFGLVLSNRSIAEGLAAAANGGPEPSRAARYRQATRNPMLAAAATAAPEGMDRDPLRDRDVIDALDEATLRWREDEYRQGRTPTKDMPQEMRDAVVREVLAARAVPC